MFYPKKNWSCCNSEKIKRRWWKGVKMKKKKLTYQKIDERGEEYGVEATQIGISNETTKQREEGRSSHPCVHIFCCLCDGFIQNICQVLDKVTCQSLVCKSLSKLHNCTKTSLNQDQTCGDAREKRVRFDGLSSS